MTVSREMLELNFHRDNECEKGSDAYLPRLSESKEYKRKEHCFMTNVQ